MNKYLIPILVLVVILGGWYGISLLEKPAPTRNDTVSSTYSCDGGKTISAIFRNGEAKAPEKAGGPPIPTGTVELKLSDGRLLTLGQTISADGVRYANPDESFVFWNKGNGALVLENNAEKSYIGCIEVTDVPADSPLTRIYSNGSKGFSIRLPEGFVTDESYRYQASPQKIIGGVKFTISPDLAEGTNLSTDSYLSVEAIPQTESCSADIFFDGSHQAQEKTDAGVTYSFAESSGAGAGNRYEETVYAIPGTNPCVAVRYLVHYGAIQNYDPGTVAEFDKTALLQEFDQIRQTLVLNQ